MHRISGAALALTAALAACGSPAPTPSPPAPTPTATPLPTPTPPPDTEAVSVGAVGVGAWQLQAIPVAMLHNHATRHGAEQVVVHFTTHGPTGRTLGSLDSEAVNLGPGVTMPVAALCTDACQDATSTDVSVTVGGWTAASGASFVAGPSTYHCDAGCGGGHGEWLVNATLTPTRSLSSTTVVAFAICVDAGGGVIGGGLAATPWTTGTGSGTVQVPVLADQPPAQCSVGASAGW